MQINTQLTGTTTTAAQSTTATNTAPTSAKVTTAATGSGFQVLRGTATNSLGTTPPPPPTTGNQPSYSETLLGVLVGAAKAIGNLVEQTLGAVGGVVPDAPTQTDHEKLMEIIRNIN